MAWVSHVGAVAATGLGASEDEHWRDLPVVISPTHLVQPLADSPVAVTVIDRDLIRATGAREIPELLRRVAGVVVGWESNLEPVVSYHGLNGGYMRRMQVLVDGRSVYDPVFGGVHWATLPLEVEDIERIEFVRGPNAATDGANAFLATISITTRQARVSLARADPDRPLPTRPTRFSPHGAADPVPETARPDRIARPGRPRRRLTVGRFGRKCRPACRTPLSGADWCRAPPGLGGGASLKSSFSEPPIKKTSKTRSPPAGEIGARTAAETKRRSAGGGKIRSKRRFEYPDGEKCLRPTREP